MRAPYRKPWVVGILLCALLAGCTAPLKKPPAPPPAQPSPLAIPLPAVVKPSSSLVLLRADQFPLFADDMDLASLDQAIEKSLQYFVKASAGAPFRMADDWVTAGERRESLTALQRILRSGDSEAVKQERIRKEFDVYQSTGLDGKGSVLFTGYFEPLIKGSLIRSPQYRYPLYRAPDDAIVVNLDRFRDRYKGEQLVGRVVNRELVPYFSRGEIEEQASLAGRNLELAWVGDRIDLFFLHIQGSGKIELPDGRLMQIGYAKSNGRPYRSIGQFLLETGKISSQEISHQAIKRYLREHPDDLAAILNHNERFVFFREVEQGPVGSIGVVLTPGRSIATDAAVFPRGSLAFVRARKPLFDRAGNLLTWKPFSRFVVSQDAGEAIKGAGRVDLFCGTGDDAERLAGSLKERGELYFLVKKRLPERIDRRQ